MVFERKRSIGRAQSQSKNSVFFRSGMGDCGGQQVVTGRQISVVVGGRVRGSSERGIDGRE